MKPLPTLLIASLAAFTTTASFAQTTADTPTTPAAPEEVITLSKFTVTAAMDKGYQAGNSVSATRIDTPIKELPFAVSAFTEQFMGDIGMRELSDVVKFAPSVTSGSEGFSSGNAFVMVRGFQSLSQRTISSCLKGVTPVM